MDVCVTHGVAEKYDGKNGNHLTRHHPVCGCLSPDHHLANDLRGDHTMAAKLDSRLGTIGMNGLKMSIGLVS